MWTQSSIKAISRASALPPWWCYWCQGFHRVGCSHTTSDSVLQLVLSLMWQLIPLRCHWPVLDGNPDHNNLEWTGQLRIHSSHTSAKVVKKNKHTDTRRKKAWTEARRSTHTYTHSWAQTERDSDTLNNPKSTGRERIWKEVMSSTRGRRLFVSEAITGFFIQSLETTTTSPQAWTYLLHIQSEQVLPNDSMCFQI